MVSEKGTIVIKDDKNGYKTKDWFLHQIFENSVIAKESDCQKLIIFYKSGKFDEIMKIKMKQQNKN